MWSKKIHFDARQAPELADFLIFPVDWNQKIIHFEARQAPELADFVKNVQTAAMWAEAEEEVEEEAAELTNKEFWDTPTQ